ncbi:uncharacterized protein LOC141627677 [Silene latifolia]|uniref:uncharacterized protein LOC141627677 n=1 Tax=Silene latifolia TaxID=37657 RepID=UPI003D777407
MNNATDETYDLTCNRQASKENDDFINRFSNERVTPDPVSNVIATRIALKVHDKRVYKQLIQECAFSSPSRTSDPKKASEKYAGSFMGHPGTNKFENMATTTERTLTDNQEDSKNMGLRLDIKAQDSPMAAIRCNKSVPRIWAVDNEG